jgi:RNA ligase (TIGR02306 family)
LGVKVDLFGEIFGQGVQDLHYGETKPVFRAFDLYLDGKPLGTDEKVAMFERLGVERVPVLYRGPWDREKLVAVRDGKTTLIKNDGKTKLHVREGVVVTAVGDQTKREYMNARLRPFLKMINPDYLDRKGETTEFS